jgi:hypothetical protein
MTVLFELRWLFLLLLSGAVGVLLGVDRAGREREGPGP